MGNSTSHVVGCFVPVGHGKGEVDLDFLEPLDEGLGHSFCYVRPGMLESPAMTPSNSERFTLDSSTLDSETLSGSFRREIMEEMASLHRPNKAFPETTFKTISGASVSANVSTVRTGNQSAFFTSDAQEPAASFESTSSFAAIPLQPLPRGSGPLNGFMSGPLERGYASGPLERGSGFMSGPLEKGGFMSGPLDSDKANFSAPLAYSRRRPGLSRLMRSVSGPVKGALTRTFSRRAMGSGWMQRFFFHPVTQFVWHPKEPKLQQEATQNYLEAGTSEGEYRNACNLQWAHGKAGEDRVHVVLSEEQGWLFVGIYDGFSGPDAPDFLMSHLYRAIDKELEGLLWDYEELSINNPPQSELIENKNDEHREEVLGDSQQSSSVSCGGLEGPSDQATEISPLSNPEMIEKNDEARVKDEVQESLVKDENQSSSTEECSAPTSKLSGQGKKSKKLYEYLNMERCNAHDTSLLEEENSRTGLGDMRSCSDGFCSRELLPNAEFVSQLVNDTQASSSYHVEDASNNRDGGGVGMECTKGTMDSYNVTEHRQSVRRFPIASKIRNMYRKQKSLRKKLFPWNYDWHREVANVDDKTMETVGPTRKCKSGVVDHDAVLRAMARALEATEEAYMEMVETMLDGNPELALMGSCVLVMLMKDQDVYVMNLGDSRAILAQERPSDRHLNPKLLTDDARHQNRSRESLVRMELDRISEESPMHTQMGQVNKIDKNREVSIWRLKMRPIQLSMDHSTDIEEEVMRIKMEHADDNQSILNNRVKGQLKVTRAFGAEFLKKSRCNEALLEMFRIDYVGTSAYISCTPSVIHHRLCSSDRFLVLSSDGLYQYFSNEEVVCHVAWFMENVPEGDPAQYLIAELLFRAAKKNGMDFHELLDIPQGDRRKYHDDVSVMVVSLEGRIWRSSG
ncbi:hypothetical protein AQUCO_02400078v1 [Aquilegia coerulea]|uniref:PPM-type phosphatase domain-containing protein n=1 Tax=Aquilegia coerulea TaxID=218851 RepID=A0A2G5DB50_AQUCA|nr:hypothetical protein AQUCO_02400078v1 [Aquilegia coerulea]